MTDTVTCQGCGQDFTEEEISAYLDRVLCRKCYPATVGIEAIRRTKQHSPYLAFALSMLFPGGGHVYAGRAGLGYILNFLVNGLVASAVVASAAVSARAFYATILAVAAVLPLVAIGIGAHATRLSQRVRRGELPEPRSLRPLWVFLAVAAMTLGLVAAAIFGSLAWVVTRQGGVLDP